jgi:hypothetical protein
MTNSWISKCVCPLQAFSLASKTRAYPSGALSAASLWCRLLTLLANIRLGLKWDKHSALFDLLIDDDERKSFMRLTQDLIKFGQVSSGKGKPSNRIWAKVLKLKGHNLFSSSLTFRLNKLERLFLQDIWEYCHLLILKIKVVQDQVNIEAFFSLSLTIRVSWLTCLSLASSSIVVFWNRAGGF